MNRGINKVILIGHLGADPDSRGNDNQSLQQHNALDVVY